MNKVIQISNELNPMSSGERGYNYVELQRLKRHVGSFHLDLVVNKNLTRTQYKANQKLQTRLLLLDVCI